MPRSSRPDPFKWRHFEPAIIVYEVRWYLRYSLPYRDVWELLTERGLNVSRTTLWRWIQRYAPELNRRLRTHLRPANRSWRIDETYIRVRGRWVYLDRAIDSNGATIEFLLSNYRTPDAAWRHCQLGGVAAEGAVDGMLVQ